MFCLGILEFDVVNVGERHSFLTILKIYKYFKSFILTNVHILTTTYTKIKTITSMKNHLTKMLASLLKDHNQVSE